MKNQGTTLAPPPAPPAPPAPGPDSSPASRWPRWVRWFAPVEEPPAREGRGRGFDPLQVPPIVLLR